MKKSALLILLLLSFPVFGDEIQPGTYHVIEKNGYEVLITLSPIYAGQWRFATIFYYLNQYPDPEQPIPVSGVCFKMGSLNEEHDVDHLSNAFLCTFPKDAIKIRPGEKKGEIRFYSRSDYPDWGFDRGIPVKK